MSEKTNPATHAVAVTASDTTLLTLNGIPPRAIWVGGAGDLNVQFGDLSSVLFAGVPAGTLLPISPHRVMSTSTTATSIVAAY